MSTNYYVCSVGEPGKEYDDANLIRCINNCCFVLHSANSQKGSYKEIKDNDVLLLKYKGKIIAYGRATSDWIDNPSIDDGWRITIPVNVWIVGNPISNYGIKNAQKYGSPYATVKNVTKEFALEKMNQIGSPF